MTVAELIEQLKACPQDSIVILQKDAEGNGYSPLHAVDAAAIYRSEATWYGEVYSTEWSADDALMDEREWEEFKKSTPPCVVLAPIN